MLATHVWVVLDGSNIYTVIANGTSMVCSLGMGTVIAAETSITLAMDLVCDPYANRLCFTYHP